MEIYFDKNVCVSCFVCGNLMVNVYQEKEWQTETQQKTFNTLVNITLLCRYVNIVDVEKK
jgi:ferredoxin